MKAADRRVVVASDVLVFALLAEIGGVDGLETDEQAPQPGRDRFLRQGRALQHRLDGPGCLPQPPHSGHSVEQGRGEARIAEQVIIEEVQVAAGQPVDFRERVINELRVELFPALEEGDLVAEVADVRAAARYHDRVRDQVQVPLDQVAADWRQPGQRAFP
jgi:hypothetical protein